MRPAQPKPNSLDKQITEYLAKGGKISKELPPAKSVDEIKARALQHELDNPRMV